MKRFTTILAILTLCVLGSLHQAMGVGVEAFRLLDKNQDQRSFTITLSGTANNTSFSGVTAVLVLRHPDNTSYNDYFILIRGYPTSNGRNMIFWNTEEGPMDTFGTNIVSKAKSNSGGLSGNHFFYLSPALFGEGVFITQHEYERRRMTNQIAEPTKIFAQTGELSINFSGNEVSGQVMMTGLDPIGHEYVHYSATFSGRESPLMLNIE